MNAFQATLEELSEANLLLHVFDGADVDHPRHIKAVEAVLEGLGVSETPRVLVMNKVDRLPEEDVRPLADQLHALPICAVTRAGVPELLNVCARRLWQQHRSDEPTWADVERAPLVHEVLPLGPPSQAEMRANLLELTPSDEADVPPSSG
jgi:50S ribosomal subunit-associated GTPase HflX